MSGRHKQTMDKIRTNLTQELKQLKRRTYGLLDDKHAKTARQNHPPTEKNQPTQQEDLLRRNSREQIHQNYFIINMYEDTSPHLEKTRRNDQATTGMRARTKDQSSRKNKRLQMRFIERILGGGGRKSRRTQTLEEGSYIDDMESCNILTLRHRGGRISEVASRTGTPFPKSSAWRSF